MSQRASSENLDVHCPLCHGRLTVDQQTGEVIDALPPRRDKGSDFDQALGAVRSASQEREKDFQRAFKVERKRHELLEKKFEKAREKADDDPSRPVNPLDLD
ncbi:MAG: hypothetical protein JSV80_07200 [Acidobacteriota bacterium]|nr:MAG: hypothetical protein JSV80_07200 [Acidobacteriota bacterium]